SKRRILLSVDVEAFELRSKIDPVERLIWGRFPEGQFGLERIMSIAEGRGAPLTMFLDYPEHYAYGDSFLDVGREIVRRGHDLNLHLHLDCIPPGYFTKRGLPEGLDLNTFGIEATNALVSDVLSLHSRVSSDAPVALRGGGYRYNDALLRSLRSHGIAISSNYNQAAKLQPYDLGPKRQFSWDNGVIELPIATRAGFLRRSYLTHFNFNIGPFMVADSQAALANSRAFLDEFFAEHGDDAVAVFVLHSWSFLRMDAGGEFSIVNPDAPERLDALLRSWSEWAEFVTARDLAALAARGELILDGPVAIPATQTSSEAVAVASVPVAVDAAASGLVCPICGTPISKFVDYNGPKRQCPDCGSTERQRVLAEVYTRFIKPELDLVGKDVLIAAPASSEKRFFKAQGISWRSVDIRPEVKADIAADLCNLAVVESASFDAVIASFVLTCVHDLDACLAELQRILRPGGRLLTCDPIRFGGPTVEYSDPERITSWYGQEAYDKYRVGSFRTFGDLDLIRTLQRHGFVVKTLYGFDAATESRWVWHMSIKDAPPR
ncbi:MAG TPA: methyltransferase domain-containing protein, partial [Polyangiaceae bacterium]|nr:methyltransferase domain-containing protein [Polyangiaceae bacterium]